MQEDRDHVAIGQTSDNVQKAETIPHDPVITASQDDHLFKEPRLSLYRSQVMRREPDQSGFGRSIPLKQNSEGSPVYQKDLAKSRHKHEKSESTPKEKGERIWDCMV